MLLVNYVYNIRRICLYLKNYNNGYMIRRNIEIQEIFYRVWEIGAFP